MNQGFYLTLLMGPVTVDPAPRYLIDSLTSVEITTHADSRSGFQLTFAVSKASPIVRDLLPSGFFDAARRVILILTLQGRPTTLMDGVITRQDFTPSNEPGQSTLSITGLDISQMMDLIDATGEPWPAMPPEARVALILSRYAMYGVIPIIIPSPGLFVDSPIEKMPVQQGTDYQYIKKLADETGYTFYVEPGPTAGMNFAYWGPAQRFGVPQPALSVNMDVQTNVESLSFSFDGLGKKQFIFYVQDKQSKTNIPIPVPDISPLNPPLGLKQPVPLGIEYLNKSSSEKDDDKKKHEEKDKDKDKDATSKLSIVQAVTRGIARTAQAADVISASGSLDVAIYGQVLTARGLVGVRGAGPAYDGQYFVKSVTHKIKRGSYKQSFSLSRNAHISLTSRVAV